MFASRWNVWAALLLWLASCGCSSATFPSHGAHQHLNAGVYTLGWRAARSGGWGTPEPALRGGSAAGPPAVLLLVGSSPAGLGETFGEPCGAMPPCGVPPPAARPLPPPPLLAISWAISTFLPGRGALTTNTTAWPLSWCVSHDLGSPSNWLCCPHPPALQA